MSHEVADALEQLRSENERLKREKNAAVADLKRWKICATCRYYAPLGVGMDVWTGIGVGQRKNK